MSQHSIGKPDLSDYLHLHFLVVIWGFTAILGLLLEPLEAPALVVYRTLLSALGLGVVLYYRRQLVIPRASVQWQLMGTGALMAIHWIAFFGAARLANASVCLAGMATGSLWTSVLEPLFLRRRIRAVEVLLGGVVIAGLYVIFRFEFDRMAGLLMAIFSAMLAAVFTIINSRFTQRYNALTISFYEMIGAFGAAQLFLLIYMWVSPDQSLWSADRLVPTSATQWLWLAVLAFVCTVYAYTAAVQLMRKFSAYAVNLTVNLEPVYGIVLAFLVFGESERMTSGFYIGTLIILLAVLAYPWLNGRLQRSSAAPVEAAETGGLSLPPNETHSTTA
ncbi:DMT family transporter [Nibrella saemangeumensis]|uniref:DMT family transporter n=1 Tax=Nibrella saemangeumensis TaxID=1084526 RepID=A0ABP8N1J6_9BACT